MPVLLIADSGATKCEWCIANNERKKIIFTTGISPYFLDSKQIVELLQKELMPQLQNVHLDEVHFYGTGLGNPANVTIVCKALKKLFPAAKVKACTDLLAAARALCRNEKGIACILGTGSNSCYYNGKKIVKNTPSLGYVLGDEGSGASLGKKVIQYYLYNTFDEDLKARFDAMFVTTQMEILENVYKKPLPNRYLASFAIFLSENRGHYMVENILEDCLNDFFLNQLYKYTESWTMPINFIGSIAFGFKDVLQELCYRAELDLGQVLKNPMEGLVKYHTNQAEQQL
jgi:glucosamine kinase